MGIKSTSDILGYRIFIFDLDNTIYNEEEYLFQGYAAIAHYLATVSGDFNENEILSELIDTYRAEGRERLFDKVLTKIAHDNSLLSECVNILRTFKVTKKLTIAQPVRQLMLKLLENNRQIYILTNGNPDQQKNKAGNIDWGPLKNHFTVLYANELEPKPSAKGITMILNISGRDKSETLFIGDSLTDRLCAQNGGVDFMDVRDLSFISKE